MATLNGGSLALVDRFEDNETTLLTGALHIASFELGGTTFIYASAANGDAIEVFTMADNGALTNVGQVTDTGGLALDRAWGMKTFEVDGNPFLAVAAATDDGISLFSLTASAPYLTFADSVFQTEDVNLNLDRAFGLDVVETSSGTFLYVAGYVSSGISSFSVASNGTLTPLANLDDDGTLAIGGAVDVVAFTRGGSNYIAVSGYDDGGVSVFFVSSSGALSEVDSLAGLEAANGVWEMAGATIGSDQYFYLPGTNVSSISVVRFDGIDLEEVQVIRSLDGLAAARAAEVISIGDRQFLATLEDSGSDLQLFEIETSSLSGETGFLSPVQTVSGPEFQGSGGLETVIVGGVPYLVAGSNGPGIINVLAIGGGDDILDGTQNDDEINGFDGDDLIRSLAGNDTIDGGDGTDIIFAGSGLDTVFASLGNDRSNGGSGFDTFDVSAFDNASNGVTVDLFNERFIQPGGGRQFITDFERVNGTNRDDTIVGDEKNNDLRGGSGDDTLRGREGNDGLRGQNGDDMLIAGDGDDFLFGGNGDDLLNGGNGDDLLDGGVGNDQLFAGAGNDDLVGGSGNDLMRGNGGADVMAGGGGNDDARGSTGNDTIFGNGGDDYIAGDSGNDTLNAGSGDDTVVGGTGADVFDFRAVASGGGGYNTVKDFTNGQDLLDLSTYGLTFTQINTLMEQRAWGARIEFADGQVIALEGFNKSEFDAGDLL